MERSYQIRIGNVFDAQYWQNLTSLLEWVLPVKFIFSGKSESDESLLEGEIFTNSSVIPEGRGISRQPGSLSMPDRVSRRPNARLTGMVVEFLNDPDVPFPYRGRKLQVQVAAELKPLTLQGGERILAHCELGPLWVVVEDSGVKHFTSAFTLPELGPGSELREVLNEHRFIEMLPLICWLREICDKNAYTNPPLRACFIFDDPNLHWTSYGFVDFRQIAEHAARENYHVAFATIPLDAWFTHQATTRVFRSNARYMSLMVHGNDHTKQELALDYNSQARGALLQRAMHRIKGLETKTGLPVSRVMVPPHGACSEAMLAELPRYGFEAACISHGSLRAHNQDKTWTRHIGYLPAESIQGCPVLPRWGMSGNLENTILLAAFLGQPIIFRGHHQDLKGGIELLNDLAKCINRLGPVIWSNMTDLCRMNYQWRMEGDIYRVKPLGRKLLLQVPDQASQLIIQDKAPTGWVGSGHNGEPLLIRVSEPVKLPGLKSRKIIIESGTRTEDSSKTDSHRTTANALLRRLLTEGRDRLLPLIATR